MNPKRGAAVPARHPRFRRAGLEAARRLPRPPSGVRVGRRRARVGIVDVAKVAAGGAADSTPGCSPASFGLPSFLDENEVNVREQGAYYCESYVCCMMLPRELFIMTIPRFVGDVPCTYEWFPILGVIFCFRLFLRVVVSFEGFSINI